MDKIFELIKKEKLRQKEQLQMIPSENYASAGVMKAVGSCLMNKYAEGLAGKRYYQGNKNVDEIERLCQKRALEAFGLSEDKWGVNVQALSGSPANLGVYNGLLEPGDKILSMYLPDGGHLSHGWQIKDKKITLVSKIWKIGFYGVDKKTLVFDYKEIEKKALKFRPKMIICGGTAYPREIDHRSMGKIAKKVGAFYLADVAHEAGLIVGKANKSPFADADVVTMTTHKTLRGPRGALIFGKRKLMDKINSSVFPGMQGGPHIHSMAGIAVALKEVKTESFAKYAKQVVKNAQILAKELKKTGLKVVSGGTDKHLVLLDLRSVGVSGWIAAWALEAVGIIVNRNTVPFETASPYYPSGLRMGTPALTSRGMKEKEMKIIAGWIIEVIETMKQEKLPEDKDKRKEFVKNFKQRIFKDKFLLGIGKQVKELAIKYPVPGV